MVTDESFLDEEKKCENTLDNTDTKKTQDDLLAGVDVPTFDDTLEEVDFILKLGLKLKAEHKTEFQTPPYIKVLQPELVNSVGNNGLDVHPSAHSSVQMNVNAQSSPTGIFLDQRFAKKRLSDIISPIGPIEGRQMSCRSNVNSQVK